MVEHLSKKCHIFMNFSLKFMAIFVNLEPSIPLGDAGLALSAYA